MTWLDHRALRPILQSMPDPAASAHRGACRPPSHLLYHVIYLIARFASSRVREFARFSCPPGGPPPSALLGISRNLLDIMSFMSTRRGHMTDAHGMSHQLQEQVLDPIRKSARVVVTGAYDLAEQLLAAQRKLAEHALRVASPALMRQRPTAQEHSRHDSVPIAAEPEPKDEPTPARSKPTAARSRPTAARSRPTAAKNGTANRNPAGPRANAGTSARATTAGTSPKSTAGTTKATTPAKPRSTKA